MLGLSSIIKTCNSVKSPISIGIGPVKSAFVKLICVVAMGYALPQSVTLPVVLLVKFFGVETFGQFLVSLR